MKDIETELYSESIQRLPLTGKRIIGLQNETSIVVYQAYKKAIAGFAVEHQFLGGREFSYNRMSWIKPNFLWMMFRCGWAEKENQDAVLAITISKDFFIEILRNAVMSSFVGEYYPDRDAWKEELKSADARLQWDPDHDPFGNKLARRAIQLGLKGDLLEKFGKQETKKIVDITPFVREQKGHVDRLQINSLVIPYETVFETNDSTLNKKIGIHS